SRKIHQCFECRARSRHQEPLDCISAIESILCLLQSICQWQRPPPDARTSHLRTLSKIFGAGLSAFPVSRRSNLPEGAAHHTAVFVAVNTVSAPFFYRVPPVQPKPAKRAAHYARAGRGWEALFSTFAPGTGYG